MASCSSFDVGHLVWAKVQGIPWWPGQIMDPLDAPKDVQAKQRQGWRLVSFFGDNKWAFSQDSRMVDFEPNIEQHEQQKACNKQKTWRLGVEEAKEVAARRAGRPPLTEHNPKDFTVRQQASATPGHWVTRTPATACSAAARRPPGTHHASLAAAALSDGSGGGNHGGCTPASKRQLKLLANPAAAAAAAAAAFSFAAGSGSFAGSYFGNGRSLNGVVGHGTAAGHLLVPAFTTTGPGPGGGGGGGAKAMLMQHQPGEGMAAGLLGLSAHTGGSYSAPGYIKTMLLAGGSYAEKVGHPPPASVGPPRGNGAGNVGSHAHPAPTARRGGTSRAIELARSHVAAAAAAGVGANGGAVHGGGVRKHARPVASGPRLSVAFAALAAAGDGTPPTCAPASLAHSLTNHHRPIYAAPMSTPGPSTKHTIGPTNNTGMASATPTPSPPALPPSAAAARPPRAAAAAAAAAAAGGGSSHSRAAAAGVAAAIALVAPSSNRSNQHTNTAGYQHIQNQQAVPWTAYLQLTAALPSDMSAVGAKASLAWLRDIARGGGGGVMPAEMSARKQLLSFDLSKRVAHMWRISGGRLAAVTKVAALSVGGSQHLKRVTFPSADPPFRPPPPPYMPPVPGVNVSHQSLPLAHALVFLSGVLFPSWPIDAHTLFHQSVRKAALNHTQRVALPSKLVTDHEHRGAGPMVPAYGPAGAPCMNVMLSVNNQVLPFLCYANIHFSNIASRETTQHQLVGLTGALECYSHTTKYIDGWELLAPGLVLMSLHMPTAEPTGAPAPGTSHAGLALPGAAGNSKQLQQQPAWAGSGPAAALAVAAALGRGGSSGAAAAAPSLAAQLLHGHGGGAPRRSAAIAAAAVVAAASHPRSGSGSLPVQEQDDDSDYEDFGMDGPGNGGSRGGEGGKRARNEASRALGRPPSALRREDEVKRSHKAARLSTGGALVTNMRRLVGSVARDQPPPRKLSGEHLPAPGTGGYTSPTAAPGLTLAASRGLSTQLSSGLDPPLSGVHEGLRRTRVSGDERRAPTTPSPATLQLPRLSSHPSSAAAAAGYISHFGGTRLLATGSGLRLQHADFSQPSQQQQPPHAHTQQRGTPHGSGQPSHSLPPPTPPLPCPHLPIPPPQGLTRAAAATPSQQQQHHLQHHLQHLQQLHQQQQQQQQQQHPQIPHRHTHHQPNNRSSVDLMHSEAAPDVQFPHPDLDPDMPGGEVSFGPGSEDEQNPDPSLNTNGQQQPHQTPHRSQPTASGQHAHPLHQQQQQQQQQHAPGPSNSQEAGSLLSSGGIQDPPRQAWTGPDGAEATAHAHWVTSAAGGSNSGAGGTPQPGVGAAGARGQQPWLGPPSEQNRGSRRGQVSGAGRPQRGAYPETDEAAARGGGLHRACESYKMRVNAAASRLITQAVQSPSLRSEAKQCFIQISRDLIQVALSLEADTVRSLDIAALAHKLIGDALSDGLELRSDDRWALIALATDLLQ
ncbi:MAG: hypothetical protein WDW36_006368 [Sanguina aurantia]